MALGKTNAAGGGGTGGTLVVTVPVGVTVTATNETLGKTYTRVANWEGKATFKGLASGTWAITMTDGSQTTNPISVVVNSEYAIELSFFSAYIDVTYPAGSVCTATDGVTTLTAPDVTGTWNITVPNAGKWIIKCYDGADYDSSEKKKSVEVEITTEGQSESVKLAYEFVLFDNGVVDGISWDLHSTSNRGSNDTSTVDDKIRINYNNNVGWAAGSASYVTDLTEYKTLKLLGKVNWANTQAQYPAYIGVTDATPTSGGGDSNAAILENQRLAQTKLTTTEDTYSVDISAINGVHRVIFGGTDNAEASRIWLE